LGGYKFDKAAKLHYDDERRYCHGNVHFKFACPFSQGVTHEKGDHKMNCIMKVLEFYKSDIVETKWYFKPIAWVLMIMTFPIILAICYFYPRNGCGD
jgi:hypothetical protein